MGGLEPIAMATKDITDLQVCDAYAKYNADTTRREFPYDILQRTTGQPEKVCYRAIERAYSRDLIEFGVSLRTGWLTEKGNQLLKASQQTDGEPLI